ncbi:MAG TPA: NAD-dependent epimerase/dehydratase family protein, partial [Polyangiaceae bacterium]|nr:NAD-dependent epimerase/dehydratase family protein [Polyangiaceae bacterium]
AGQRVVVTGGAGFIGSHLVRRLLEMGAAQVVVIDSLRYGDQANLAGTSEAVELVQHTLGTDNPKDLDRALDGADLLFHLAAEKHNQSKDSPDRVYRANIAGTHGLYERAVAAGVKKVVFSSSLYAYGRMRGAPFVETELPQPRTVYGITKLAGEHVLAHFAETHGLSTMVLRYLFIYGPKQFAGMGYKSVIMKSFDRLLAGEAPIVFGDGEQTLDYVYVDDAVDATISAMTQDVSGETLNVASGRGVSVNELLDTMIRVSGKQTQKEPGPADWTAGTKRIGDPSHAQKVLGFSAQTSLEDGLRKTYDWIRSQ